MLTTDSPAQANQSIAMPRLWTKAYRLPSVRPSLTLNVQFVLIDLVCPVDWVGVVFNTPDRLGTSS